MKTIQTPFEITECLAAAEAVQDAYSTTAGGGTRIVVGSLQLLLREERHRTILAIPGTDDRHDVKLDAKAWPVALAGGSALKVHAGFWEGCQLVQDTVRRLLMGLDPNKRLVLACHSLGSAVGLLLRFRLLYAFPRNTAAYLFGTPGVGNRAFAEACWIIRDGTWLVDNNNDAITWLLAPYHRPGRRVYLTHRAEIVHEPSRTRVWADRLLGRAADLGRPGSDGAKDHFIRNYVATLKKAAAAGKTKSPPVAR